MDTPENALQENRRLRRTMRDLVALSTLPAVWTGLGPADIARSLADVLLHTLSLDLIYVRLAGLTGEGVIEVVRSKHRRDAAHDEVVKASLAVLLGSDRTDPPNTIPDPFGAGTLHVAVTRFGISGDHGVLITASANADFPTERDRLLLGVGANQTAIVVQRKRAEEQVREQAERLRTTLASIGDAVIATDTGGRITTMNAVAESLTGWATVDAVGQPLDAVFNIVNQTTRRPVENPATRALREGVVVGLANHTILIGKDGAERPIDDSAAPIRCNEGKVVGCVLVFRDITERRRQEVELYERERQFRTLAESIPQMAWMANPDGHILWYNRRWYDYTGTSFEQMQGWGWQSVHDPDVLPKVVERWQASLSSGEPFDMEFPLKGKDGVFRSFLTRVEPLKDDEGRVVRWFGTNTDVTVRKQAEDKLQEVRNRLDAILAAAEVGTWEFDPIHNIVRADPNLARMFGVRPDEAAGGPLEAYTRAIHPDDWKRVSAAIERALAASDRYDAEYRLVGPGETVRWVVARGRVERDEDGRAVRLPGVVVDITEQKRAEQQLQEADRRKDEFLATLAHELRNPLAPLRNALQVMRLSPAHEVREQVRSMMERQLGQLVRLVDDLMDLSRISRGNIELKKERVQLAAVVGSAVETSRPLIEEMGHGLTVTLPKHPVVIEVDLTRMAQVFMNLLNNSAKYSDRGGHIWLTAERHGNDVVVSVKDVGIGIAADKLTSIFDMFSQVDRSLEKAQGGLGIGLSLVKRLVEMHGGRIEARSEGLGRGSEFVVRLPFVVEASMPQTADATEQATPKSLLRILIVDDNRDGADSLSMMLRIMGNDTRTAYDGEQAVGTAGEFRPDVVLLDIGLPKLNGYEACRRIREQSWGKGVVLIAVTGWGQEEDRRRSHEAGFDHHVVKPVDPHALMKLLAELQMVKR